MRHGDRTPPSERHLHIEELPITMRDDGVIHPDVDAFLYGFDRHLFEADQVRQSVGQRLIDERLGQRGDCRRRRRKHMLAHASAEIGPVDALALRGQQNLPDQLADIGFIIALLRQRAGARVDPERETDGVQRLRHQMTATASAPSLTLNEAGVSSVFAVCATWLTCIASSFTSVPFTVMREPVFVSMTISPSASSMRIVKLSVLKNLIEGAASAAAI